MLILGRKKHEKILIGNDITISIEDITNTMVKIGIDAPKEVMILRGELKERIIASNLQATTKISEKELKDITKILSK